MKLAVLLSVGMAFALIAAAEKADVPKDLEKLQGSWVVTKMEAGGKEDKECVDDTFTVTGDKFTIKKKDGTEKMAGTIKVNINEKPATIDLIMKDKEGKETVMKGVCKLDGETLMCCMALEPGKDRPTEIASKENTRCVVLKRVQPKPGR